LINEIGWLGSVNNVGTFSFNMAVHLGANEIYTIGNDAAFDQETGNRYASDSSFVMKDNLKDSGDKNFISNYDVVEVKGNLQDKVKTNRNLLTFKESFESSAQELRTFYTFDLFNLSHGAYISGFEPMRVEEFKKVIDNSKVLNFDIKSKMDDVSVIVEMPDYDEDIKIINTILARVKKHKKYRFNSKNEYLEKKLDLMIWILKKTKLQSSEVFGNLFLQYTELVDIYLNFLLNLKQNNLYTKENLIKINQMYSDGILWVFKDIKRAIK
jgi:hypothetical protein